MYELIRQNGRLLNRLDEVEARLGIGQSLSWHHDPSILALVRPELIPDAPTIGDPTGSGIRLNLGTGDDAIAGWVNHDRLLHPGVDVAWDLRQFPWPLDDNSCDRILARDVLEHLPDVVDFMDECWRLLRPDGVLVVQAVLAHAQERWIDPTHVRGFVPATFEYFDPERSNGNKYGRWYTERHWRLLTSEIGGPNVVAVLCPRKAPPDCSGASEV
jgi:SAM-dependent methyltransferase